jgi:hypothetical protein
MRTHVRISEPPHRPYNLIEIPSYEFFEPYGYLFSPLSSKQSIKEENRAFWALSWDGITHQIPILP